MQIEIKKTSFYEFSTLDPGEVFEFNGVYYVKLEANKDPMIDKNAIDLYDFNLFKFFDGDKVRLVDSKLIIDD